ncbi:MAG TPA: 4-hydroxythreonine-4-phosphate dehydrogenase PdxA [Stellaceae bacterium]|nr:4-hydroxythreonine-4-phosphate dehydrogenase PdxA [Stellaceae bacterium]
MALQKVAISMGDPAGIGPEIALKATLDPRVRGICAPLLVGDRRALEIHAKASGLAPRIRAYRTAAAIDWNADGVALLDLALFGDAGPALGTIDPANGRAAVESARAAVRAALDGHIDAVVAAPQTELAIKQAGIDFDGYPSFVAREAGVPEDDVFLMLCFDDKKIVHATLHVGLRRALELITLERVKKVIACADETLRRIGVARPVIAVAGINPHASEHGMFGDEEARIIAPVIAEAQKAGIRVEGPFGADTIFHRSGVDAFIVMYHDQGHIAAKLLARNRVAALVLGTPVVFSSVAHGSALDIAGQNRASPEAVVEAVCRLVGTPLRKAA